MAKRIFAVAIAMMLLCGIAFAAVTDGTYEATATGMHDGLKVAVTFEGGKIADVKVIEHSETQGISDPAIEKIPAEIAKHNSVLVDAVAGATMTSNGILTAVKDAIAQAGGDAAEFENAIVTEAAARTAETLEADVVIVGGGMAGLSAAMSAADAGANVLLIEKMASLGGSAAMSSGAIISVNSEEVVTDLDDSIGKTLDFFVSTAALGADSGYPDMALVENVLADTGKTVDYFARNGMKFGRLYDMGYAVSSISEGGGAGMIKAMSEAVYAKGVNVMLNCKGTELIMDGAKVVGVKAEGESADYTINAKNVILATGGFDASREMIDQYIPGLPEIRSRAAAGVVGDGLAMAMSAGAVMFENSWPMVSTTMLAPEYSAQVPGAAALKTATQPIVNGKGVRFCNEASASYSSLGNDIIKDNCFPYNAIYDSANAELIEALEAGIALGEVVKGETIADLAAAMGMDAAVLEETMKTYNAACAAGADEYGKAAASLIAIEQGPFYAVKFYPTTIGTMSGVKTDETGHVLDAQGAIIEGLYAVGEMSNRAFYNEHYIGGASLALYSTMGLRAGADAAK